MREKMEKIIFTKNVILDGTATPSRNNLLTINKLKEMGDDPDKLNLYWRITQKFNECMTSDGGVSTVKFGEAALMMAPVYDWIFGPGMVSRHLKNDIIGHATGILDSAALRKENATVKSLIATTLQNQTHQEVKADWNNGVIKILWTKRSLDFILRFLNYGLIENTHETLQRSASMAYSQVLKPYHSIMVSGIVTLALNLTPSREVFLKNMGFDSLSSAQKVFREFLAAALPVMDHVHKTLLEYNCNFNTKA